MHAKRTEPTAAALAADLADLAVQFAATNPGISQAMRRDSDQLRQAPPSTPGASWLGARGHVIAQAASLFYVRSRTRTRRRPPSR